MKRYYSLSILLAFLRIGVQSGYSQSIETNRVVLPFPPDLSSQAGNSLVSLFGGGPFQEMLRGSTLSSVWTGPVKITAIAFRVEEQSSSSFSAVIPKVEIHLSTSSRTLEQMSTVWGNNKGADETIVYLHDNVSLFGAVAQPFSPFDLRFELDEPFVYDPNAGNLAMLFVATGPFLGQVRTVDMNFFQEPNSPSMLVNQGFAGPVPVGIVTEFSFVAVPEPGSISMIGLGMSWLLWRAKRKGKPQ